MNKQFEDHAPQRMISPETLLALGGPNLAYIGRVVIEGTEGYGIHGADGTVLAVAESRELAFAAARQHNLLPVSVH